MRLAVVGHVEWVEFARVERVPAPGEIVHVLESWAEPGGGGGVAAVELARLAGEATLFTSLGADELGERSREALEAHGVRVHAAAARDAQRRAFTFVDASGERTIAVVGHKLVPRRADPLPWDELAGFDGVFFVSGDAAALRAARTARVLVATPRELPTLLEAGVQLDALVGSGEDEGERYRPGDLEPPPRLAVATEGAAGGVAVPGGPYAAVPPPGPPADVYGCGDCFAAGLTFALAGGASPAKALEAAATRGAAALTRRGAGVL